MLTWFSRIDSAMIGYFGGCFVQEILNVLVFLLKEFDALEKRSHRLIDDSVDCSSFHGRYNIIIFSIRSGIFKFQIRMFKTVDIFKIVVFSR